MASLLRLSVCLAGRAGDPCSDVAPSASPLSDHSINRSSFHSLLAARRPALLTQRAASVRVLVTPVLSCSLHALGNEACILCDVNTFLVLVSLLRTLH